MFSLASCKSVAKVAQFLQVAAEFDVVHEIFAESLTNYFVEIDTKISNSTQFLECFIVTKILTKFRREFEIEVVRKKFSKNPNFVDLEKF